MSKPIPYKKVTIIYVAWWIAWIAVQTIVLVQNGFDWNAALIDSVTTQLVFAIGGYTINTSMRSYQPSLRNSLYVAVWAVALATVCYFIQRWIVFEFGNDVGVQFMEKTMILRISFGWLMIVLVAILTWFWVYASDRMDSEKRKDDATKLARDAELSNLRQQLQPHFLFNSLNSISALAGSRPDEARKMIQQLSDFLRGTMKKDDNSSVTFDEELRHLQLYLDIEKVRFGHRLITNVQKTEETLTLRIPALLLQPIVENAIKFGLYDTVGEITITISAKKENNDLIVQIMNPFDPATAMPKRGTGFGLSSIQRRLYLLFFRNDLLATSQNENTFTTIIKIPQTA